MESNPSDPVVIAGGGLAGMMALYQNLRKGIPTVLYERSRRGVGGVVQLKDAGDKMLDMGGELVDSGHKELLGLARELGLKPIDTWKEDPEAPPSDVETQQYSFAKNGRVYSNLDFLTPSDKKSKAAGLFVELAREIRRDYDQMGEKGPQGDWLDTPFNRKLDMISTAQYLDEKCKKLAAEGKPVDPAVIQSLENAYQCENGRELSEIPALLFVNQLGQGESGKGLSLKEGFSVYGSSDERYVIPGGTAAVIEKLREKSEELARKKGFPEPIHTGMALHRIERAPDGKTRLHFTDAKGATSSVDTPYVISALQAPVLGRIEGVENLGLTPQQTKGLKELQFTHSSKVFFEVEGTPWGDFTATGADGKKVRIKDADGCFFGDTIKECWQTGDGELTRHGTTWITCLVGGKTNDKYRNSAQLIEACKQEYARILGKRPEELFVSSGDGKPLGTAILSYKVAGGGIGCYCSPGVKQAISSTKLSADLNKGTPVAGFTGGWLTSVDRSNGTPNLGIGFLNNGVASGIQASLNCEAALTQRSGARNEAKTSVAQRVLVSTRS